MTRYFVGLTLALALAAMGCSETAGTGGSGGTAGSGGEGGAAGVGGDGGVGGVAGDGGASGAGGSVGDVFPCTEQGIRDAIAEGGGPHTFDCGDGMTVVTQAEIVIDNDVILDGEGKLTVDGTRLHRVFFVAQDVATELRGVMVTQGNALRGGGIHNEGMLTLTDSAVSGNSASAFGGIVNRGTLTLTNSVVSDNYHGGIETTGTLTMTNSTVSDNSALPGIDNGNRGEVTLTDSTVSGNNGGGGIFNAGTVTLTNCTVSGNFKSLYGGGGVANVGVLTMTNSTVAGNTAAVGGGIDNEGTLSLIHSTVSGNTATDIVGGGILNMEDLTLINSTVSGNQAAERDGLQYGGGIYNGGSVTLINSTISGNNVLSDGDGAAIHWQGTVVDSECLADVATGTSSSNGYNIESPGDTCGFDQTGDQASVPDPMLGPLQNNGGPTETHALLPGSPAINQIPTDDCDVEIDQRGEPRPETGGTMCDVGAFERQTDDP